MWWLPDTPDSKVPGTLSYSPDGLKLTVYGRGLQPVLMPAAAGAPSVFTKWEVNPLAHGELRDGRPVTLISAAGLWPCPS
ncbi:ApeA N-terminal domain 1-containing protein [Kitasatospora aureofaciens]|uniref:ApeA N-terminal domain 1-containing protein n=1 Tax=Kitasatospora aureofaciens TaxID=1894 RepID=UPI0035A8420B